MPTPKRTTRSTRRLSEVARHVVIPDGIVTTGWPAVEAKALEFGDEFDEWQSGAGKVMLGRRADGIYAATIGGVTLSIPRQVAKTFLVGRIVFILCVLFPGLTVLWSAHRTRTSTRTFQSMKGYAARPKVAAHVLNVRSTNGEQEIEFVNGSKILFGARELGFGRGFEEVDIEVFDEAQILTERALEDMIAATNQSRHVHGALLFFMGTPPRPVDPGESFTARRTEALSGESEDAVYIECSADPDADPDDREQWAIANPSYPHRTPLRSMLRLRKNLPSVDSWKREALGIWDSAGGDDGPISRARWADLVDTSSSISGEVSTAIDVSPDTRWATIAAAGTRSDGHVHVEIASRQPGTDWVVPFAVRNPQHGPYRVVGGSSPGAFLKPLLEDAGVWVVDVPATEVTQATQRLIAAVDDGTIHHLGDDRLASALSNAIIVQRGDSQTWSRVKSSGDISALVAATVAVGGVRSDVDPIIRF